MKISAAQAAAQERIAAELATVGLALPGTLSLQRYRCGKPVCRCRADPPQLHGPYAQWTRKIDQRTVTRRLSAAELADYGPLFDNAKRLRALVAELQALTLAIVEPDAEPAHPRAPTSRRARSE
ncbi:MAG: hypothetical protein M0Z49_00110 [Chloroflexi bacterium]|nr:hypothetical protein [Chloroflexota bacterium]